MSLLFAFWRAILAIALACSAVCAAASGEETATGVVDSATTVAEEDEEGLPAELPPGLRAEYIGADKQSFARIDLLPRVTTGVPTDPRIASEVFSVRWTGKLLAIAPGKHMFHLYAAGGAVELAIDGKTLINAEADEPAWLDSAPVELVYGHHAIELVFRKLSPQAQLGLYWSGPRFERERVPERFLFHDRAAAVDREFDDGRKLVHGLRCAACHDLPDTAPAMLAPSLVRLRDNMSRAWLMDWIGGRKAIAAETTGHAAAAALPPVDKHPEIDDVKFRMPGLGLAREDARHLVAFLLDEPPPTASDNPEDDASAKKASEPTDAGDVAAGRELFYSLGCLACHAFDGVGSARVFGGGDLSALGDKRPAEFFARWLADPAKINPAHRMPVFQLSDEERANLAAFLSSRATKAVADRPAADAADFGGLKSRGRELAARHHCHACHELPQAGVQAPAPDATVTKRLPSEPDWENSCVGDPDVLRARPGYRLRPEQRRSIVKYLQQIERAANIAKDVPAATAPGGKSTRFDGAQIVQVRNCLSCHARRLVNGISATLPAVIEAHPELSAVMPALSPPALTDVGDKLERAAILAAVQTPVEPRRPWLKVRMPRFRFATGEAEALADWLIAMDRLPDRLPERATVASGASRDRAAADADALFVAGRRLVTSDGFGCASCHQIGKSKPTQENLAALGTDLSMVGERIRRAWFDRWLRNPARIVPRMEMPAIELPVPGVLEENLPHQVAAVWRVLNEPGFTPPAGGAVRVVRTRNRPGETEPAAVLTDVFRVDKQAFIRPMVVGLPNRHSVMLDFEANRLAGWWIGDTARERTEGKRWFWEAGGTHLLPVRTHGGSELLLEIGDRVLSPVTDGQCAALLDAWHHVPDGATVEYRLTFKDDSLAHPATVRVAQTITSRSIDTASKGATGSGGGFRRRLELQGLPPARAVLWKLLPSGLAGNIDGQQFIVADGAAGKITVKPITPEAPLVNEDGPSVRLTAGNRAGEETLTCEVDYTSEVSADRYPFHGTEPPAMPVKTLDCVPGFAAVRLPLPATEMPTGFAWRRDGSLLFSSLKGQVWLARDTDGDGLPDTQTVVSDDLAAPYGLADRGDAIDVINKHGLVRLSDFDVEERAQRTEVVADGWGHSADYHDWAVGLVGDGAGGYFLTLPCRQDERSAAAARLRGWAVHLAPRASTEDEPRQFSVEPFCSGLRFPMGLARRHDGALFASDNQGNYNPFNELNHLTAGQHFGFLNKIEARSGTRPPWRAAAIEIPHPWTRSVNGICFLETPPALRQKAVAAVFGPWEGHLVGCEYDTRRLVRMSLERVGDDFQGAVYPLSTEPDDPADSFEGPIACQVAPDGALYIGNMRDSGWGAGQNTGSIVRLTRSGPLPAGIAEVRATRDGFTIHFSRPVERQLGAQTAHYAVDSYRRVSTPEYGGPDVDRQTLRVQAVELSADGMLARLTVEPLRLGFLHEIRVHNLAPQGEQFHPAEAYYTLRALPDE